MPFDHKELDELDKIEWADIIWKIIFDFILGGFGILVLWYGIRVGSYIWIILGALALALLMLIVWPSKKEKK